MSYYKWVAAAAMRRTAEERRRDYRRLFDTLPKPDPNNVKNAITLSPGCSASLKKRPSWAALRDALPMVPLVGTILGFQTPDQLLNAVVNPIAHGYGDFGRSNVFDDAALSVMRITLMEEKKRLGKLDDQQIDDLLNAVPGITQFHTPVPDTAAPGAHPVDPSIVAPGPTVAGSLKPILVGEPKSMTSTTASSPSAATPGAATPAGTVAAAVASGIGAAIGTPSAGPSAAAAAGTAPVSIPTLTGAFDIIARQYAIAEAARIEASGFGSAPTSAEVEKAVLDGFFAGRADFGALSGVVTLRAAGPSAVKDYTKVVPSTNAAAMELANALAPVLMAGDPAAAASGAPVAGAGAKIDDKIVISPGVATGINAMLMADTGGKVKDINAVFETAVSMSKRVIELETQVSTMSTAMVVPAAVKHGDLDGLTYEVTMVNANDVGWGHPGRQGIIDFDVPTVVWKDPSGAVVRHPLCPEVDRHYIFKPKELAALLDALVNRDIPWVYGHTGSGKTTKIEQLAARLGFPFIRINYDAEISRADILGKTDIKAEAGGTTSYFKPGIIPQWVEKPCFILHDEMDFVRSEVSYALQRVLEKGGAIRLDEDGGRLVQVGPWCFQFAAANTRGAGDEFGMYPGAKVQTQAFLDRFAPFIEVNYLEAKQEVKLLRKRVPSLSEDLAKQFIAFANEVRQGFMQGEIMQTLSPRGLLYMARAASKFTTKVPKPKDAVDFALEMGALAKATAQDKQKLKEYADRTFR